MKEYNETILEKVLEAKDNGVGLQTLLDRYPEEKGLFIDAWKFVDSFTEAIDTDAPEKENFARFIGAQQIRTPLLSPFRMLGMFAPALVIVILVLTSFTHKKEAALTTPLTPSPLPEVAVAPDESSTQAIGASLMSEAPLAKTTMIQANTVSSIDPNKQTIIDTINATYASEYSYEITDQSISLANGASFTDIQTTYNDPNI